MTTPRFGFRGQLMLAMLGLVLVTILSIAGPLMLYLFEDEEQRAVDRLKVAEGIAQELLDRRTNQLLNSLAIMVDDFGFKSAIATGDVPTIASVLDNHMRRAHADVAIVVSESGEEIAGAGNQHIPSADLQSILSDAAAAGVAAAVEVFDAKGYQLLVVPVTGGGLNAWLVAGFRLDGGLTNSIAELAGTDVVLLHTHANADSRILATTLPETSLTSRFIDQLLEIPDVRVEPVDGWFASLTPMKGASLQVSIAQLISRDGALASYRQRAVELALLMSSVLGVALLLVMITARALGKPVLELARYAQSIGRGEKPVEPEREVAGELLLLRDSLQATYDQISRREWRLRHSVLHDPATGLPNSTAIEETLTSLFGQQQNHWIIGFSLLQFGEINDTLGYDFGDEVLICTALRLRGCAPTDCFVGRFDGNAFVAVVPDASVEQVRATATKLRQTLEEPMVINETPVVVRYAVELLRIPADAQDMNQVRRRLNLTRILARQHPDHIAFYLASRDENRQRELRLIRDLKTALSKQQLFMNYQPKVDIRSARPVQVEALVRWIHPELGFISPEEFILLAERSGQITDLTRYILHRIAKDSRQWLGEHPGIGVAINLSTIDLLDQTLVNNIRNAFRGWPAPMDRLTFEVTESAIMKEPEKALATLDQLRALGPRISIDDFGTGHSSLAQLRRLPVQELKIDKSFVLKLDTEEKDQFIVQSTIGLAHQLGLKVVAEGIENLASWQLLKLWGCDKGQGYLLSRPLPANELAAWLDKFTSHQHQLFRDATEA